MDCAPPTTEPDAQAWHHAALHTLADLTLELARAVQRQAIEQATAAPAPPAAPLTTAGLLYTRVARTLRQIIALDARLAADHHAGPRGSIAERARRAAAERHRKHAARTEIRRRLADTLDADPTPRDAEALLRDLDDRLYDDDVDAALTIASVTDIVLALCAEFGLTPDLSQCTDAEIGLHDPPARRPPAHAHPP